MVEQQQTTKPSISSSGFFTSLVSKRTVHAWLIAGPTGSGKHEFVKEAARAFLCRDRKEDGTACDVCPSCLRVMAGSHPDLLVLKAQKSSIGVEEIRQILSALANRPFEGGARVVSIEDAEKLTPQAQNALLKSLEEPPSETIYFLQTKQIAMMLPTVRSRCRILYMTPETSLVATLLKQGASMEQAQEMAVLSGGALQRALSLLSSKDIEISRAKAMLILKLSSTHDIPFVWQSLKDDKEYAQSILLWLECFCIDLLKALSGLAPLMPETHRMTSSFTIATMQSMIEEIIMTRKRLGSNVAWQTAMEPLLFTMTEGEKA